MAIPYTQLQDPEDRDYAKMGSQSWYKRSRVNPLRTFSGAVVYKRDKQFFKGKDCIRLIKYLLNHDYIEDNLYGIIYLIYYVYKNIDFRMLYKMADHVTMSDSLYGWDPTTKYQQKNYNKIIESCIWYWYEFYSSVRNQIEGIPGANLIE